MLDSDIDRLADAVARKLAPSLVVKLRLNRRNMAHAIDVSPRTLQMWSNRPVDACPCDREGTVILYEPREVSQWLSRQKKEAVAGKATAGGKN